MLLGRRITLTDAKKPPRRNEGANLPSTEQLGVTNSGDMARIDRAGKLRQYWVILGPWAAHEREWDSVFNDGTNQENASSGLSGSGAHRQHSAQLFRACLHVRDTASTVSRVFDRKPGPIV